MLSTIRLGNCTFDPYWFGIADKNMLSTALYSSGLFSPESSFALSDDMHYNRAKAGFGLSFQSVMAHFRIYGYIPLVYSHISVYSPYITPQKTFTTYPSEFNDRTLFVISYFAAITMV